MTEMRKIMVAVDESEYSKYALEWILNNLRLCVQEDDHGVSLLILHVQPAPDIPAAGGNPGAIAFGGTPPELIESIVNHQKQVSEKLLECAKDICAQKDVIAEIMMEIGDPKEVICGVIEKMQVDLLVIGSHGYGMRKRDLVISNGNFTCSPNFKSDKVSLWAHLQIHKEVIQRRSTFDPTLMKCEIASGRLQRTKEQA